MVDALRITAAQFSFLQSFSLFDFVAAKDYSQACASGTQIKNVSNKVKYCGLNGITRGLATFVSRTPKA